MSEVLPILTPILLVDVVNPLLLALMIYAAATGRSVANSSMLLAGHTVAYFAVGILVSLGVAKISAAISYRWANPEQIDFVIGSILGVCCIAWAVHPDKATSKPARTPDGPLSPLSSFRTGVIVSFMGAPFAMPYFAAVDQILKANLSVGDSLVTLGIYNALYAAPFAAVPVMVAMMGDRAQPALERINSVMSRLGAALLPLLIFALGAWLVFDAVYYWLTGTPII